MIYICNNIINMIYHILICLYDSHTARYFLHSLWVEATVKAFRHFYFLLRRVVRQ